MTDDSSERLNKLIALRKGVSRREADEMIEARRVTINGQTAVLGARVPAGAQVQVDGVATDESTPYRYVMLHKPVGYVCSRRPQGDSPTIYDLLPAAMSVLKPVGRLDKDSSGLILLTNDGDFAHRMTHPKFAKTKRYDVVLARALEPLHHQMISDYGVEIGDGTSKLQLERRHDDRRHWTVTMHEGRNRQIRRTFAALGYEVTQLHRTVFGPYQLHDLVSGATRAVTPH